MKTCNDCGVTKPLTEFWSSKRDGPYSYCKPCMTIRGRKNARKYQRKRPYVEKRDEFLRYTYGISLEEYRQMAADQGGVCKICKKANPSGKALAVDHCHCTGRIRGLLCDRRNRGIGFFDDDPQILAAAREYLSA